MKNTQHTRNNAIDIMRGIAIMAVVLDHALYASATWWPNLSLWKHLLFAPTWFLLLSGITNTQSALKKTWKFPFGILNYYQKRIPIVLLYCIATIFLPTLLDGKEFTLPRILTEITAFSGILGYYFFAVLFFCFLIFPFAYLIMKKNPLLNIAILILGLVTWYDAIAPTPHLPWHFRHIAWFLTGISITLLPEKITTLLKILAIPVFIYFEQGLLTGAWIHVPLRADNYLYLFLWAVSSYFTFSLVITPISSWKLFEPITVIGKNSLYIFLLHAPIVIWILRIIPRYNLGNAYLSALGGILIPTALILLLAKVRPFIVKITHADKKH